MAAAREWLNTMDPRLAGMPHGYPLRPLGPPFMLPQMPLQHPHMMGPPRGGDVSAMPRPMLYLEGQPMYALEGPPPYLVREGPPVYAAALRAEGPPAYVRPAAPSPHPEGWVRPDGYVRPDGPMFHQPPSYSQMEVPSVVNSDPMSRLNVVLQVSLPRDARRIPPRLSRTPATCVRSPPPPPVCSAWAS